MLRCAMVSVVMNMDETLLEKLKAKAEAEGKDVSDVAVELLAERFADDEHGYDLTDAQDQRLIDASAAMDRGEFHSAADVMAELKAATRPR